MFTEGLDPNALRWVREGSVSRQQNRIDPLRGIRNGGGGGRGLGVPPPEKFRSGHLPKAAIPVSHAIRTEDDESGSGSDMDESSDTEAENYVGRYSIDSSPRDDDNANGSSMRSGIGSRYARPVSAPRYYSSDGYSDISSSRDTAPWRQQQQQPPQQFKKPVQVNGYVEEVEEELSDSGGSSEFSSQARGPNGASYVGKTYSHDRPIRGGVNGASRGSYPAENYNRNVPFREAVNAAADKASVTSQGKHQSDSYSRRVPFRDNVKVPSNMRAAYSEFHLWNATGHIDSRFKVPWHGGVPTLARYGTGTLACRYVARLRADGYA